MANKCVSGGEAMKAEQGFIIYRGDITNATLVALVTNKQLFVPVPVDAREGNNEPG